MQFSTAVVAHNRKGSSKPFQVHPEIAEWGLRILQRDLKLQRREGIKYFIRRLYSDLNEIETIRWAAQESGKELPEEITGVVVIRLGTDTNARMPLDEEAFQKTLAEGEYPLLPRSQSKGFGGCRS